jgi:tetratricopeptide (TPR) repeat protein
MPPPLHPARKPKTAIDDLEALLVRAKASGEAVRELSVQRVVARAYYVMSLDHKAYVDKCRLAYEQTIELARAQNNRAALGAALVATAQFTDYWPEFREQAKLNLAEAGAIARETANEDLAIDVATALLSIALSGSSTEEEERLLERLLARRDPVRLNAQYFRMMWSTYSKQKFERCTQICDAGIELAYRIGTLPVQYPTIKGLAQIELGRFDQAWASFDQEIADAAHRFGAAIRDLGRMSYVLRTGAHDEALERAKHVTAESHALSRAWMLKWVAEDLAGLAADYVGDAEMIARIEALVTATGAPPGKLGEAALHIAKGENDAAMALLVGPKQIEWIGAARFETVHARLLAQLHTSGGDHAQALAAIEPAVSRARESAAAGRLWRLLGEQALIEEALGRDAATTRQEAKALWSRIGGEIPDPEHRAAFTRGPMARRLGFLG